MTGAWNLVLAGRRGLSKGAGGSVVGGRLLLLGHHGSSTIGSRAPVLLSQRAALSTTAAKTAAAVTAEAAFEQQGSSTTYSTWFSRYHLAAAVATASGVLALQQVTQEQERTRCCGIVGVVGTPKHEDVRDILLDGLTVLKNRGLDSAGMATMETNGDSMTITKYASPTDGGGSAAASDSIDLVRAESDQKRKRQLKSGGYHHSVGMAHTRWATHGAKTNANAHPHLDASGKISIVHNGTINNARQLRRELLDAGYKFDSETDSEVIAKLIGHYYKIDNTDKQSSSSGDSKVKQATEKALARCLGTWGLVVMCSDTPDELVVACHGSPLVLGLSHDRTFVASEPSAFSRHTKTFIPMKDGEIAVLHADGHTLDVSRQVESPKTSQAPAELSEEYAHWTLKEILEQPESLGRALAFGGRLGSSKILLGGLDNNYERLSKVKHLLLSGCGTSLYAARYGERLMRHLASVDTVCSIDAGELEEQDYPGRLTVEESAVIAISQSGETRDVARAVTSALDRGVTVMSIVNAVGSTIARETKLGVYCHAGTENSVTSTKTFTSQVTCLALIALWFRQFRDGAIPSVEATRLKEALMRLPLSFGMALKTHDHCKRIAQKLKNKEHCFVLGKGYAEPVAFEGSMKLKELSYLHAEGYSGGALKHGPFALIEGEEGKYGSTPVIMFILDDQHAHHMRTCAEEVKARGAEVIIITDKPSLARDLDDDPIVIPSNGPLTALGAVVPLQLIAYELAVIRGLNPDAPRNLAKVILVD